MRIKGSGSILRFGCRGVFLRYSGRLCSVPLYFINTLLDSLNVNGSNLTLRGGYPGRAAFTMFLERVGFL